MTDKQPNVDCSTKCATLWQAKPALCIGLIVAGILLVLGVAALVFFLVIKPKYLNNDKKQVVTIGGNVASHMFQHLRYI